MNGLITDILRSLRIAFRTLFGICLMLAAGCAAVGPNYKPPEVHVNPQFSESGLRPTTQPVTGNKWWTVFNDPQLNQLVNRAMAGNLDLQQAQSRLLEARYELIATGAELAPQINADGGYNHQRGSDNVTIPQGSFGFGPLFSPARAAKGGGRLTPLAAPTPAGPQSPLGEGGLPDVVTDVYQIGFDASWEIDVFGGQRRAVEAAEDDRQAALEDRRDVQISLVAEVARNYIELRGYQRQAEIARRNLALQEDTLELTRSKYQNGFVTELDVARQTAQVATTVATIPPLEYQEHVAIHSLGILLGQDPSALSAELSETEPLPPLPPNTPVGLPSDLLRRRPDIRRAERRLAASTARIGVAVADLYPKFTITGLLGLDSSTVNHLLEYSSRYYSIVPGMTWSIFSAGQVQANIDKSNEEERQAALQYQQAVLNALGEVEDSLAACRTEQLRGRALQDAVTASRQASDLAREQYQRGVVDFLTVLDAERDQLTAETALAASDQAACDDLVSLYKALGGGWDVDAHS
jgi:outer membrane protein, multidrug efflux system